MPREILVPIDGSEPAWDALTFALEQHSDAAITAYYVIDDVPSTTVALGGSAAGYEKEYYEAQTELAKEVLSDADSKAAEYGQDIETHYERGRPATKILEYVETGSIDQIIMGSHGRSGLTRVVLGSVAEKIVRHSSVPVTIVRSEPEENS